ncbi:MAG: hypothetical protein BGO08_01070 [Altererythrobacter sp. 66-12]|nr:MAG: hypothetical protein BGO08_01070 [Altererythrobacter sp. 66-12]
MPLRPVHGAGRGPLPSWPGSPRVTPEEEQQLKRARRGRNIALALVLVGLVVLFYAISIVKMLD